MKTLKLIFASFIISLISCSKNEDKTSNNDILKNPNSSNGNPLIAQENISTTLPSSIYKLIITSDGNLVYIAKSNTVNFELTKTNLSGTVIWKKQLNYLPTDIKQINSNYNSADIMYDGYVIIGKNNSNVSTFDKNGNQLDQKQIGALNSSTGLNSFLELNYPNSISINNFLAAGYANISNHYYPYYKSFSVNNQGIITANFTQEVGDIPIPYLEGVDNSNIDKIALNICSDNDNEKLYSNFFTILSGQEILKGKLYLNKYSNNNLLLTKDYNGYYSSDNCLLYKNNNLYIAGAKDDTSTSTTYTDGTIPKDAFISKLDTSGNIIWEKTYSCTEGNTDFNDAFEQIIINNDKMIAVGYSSYVKYTSINKLFRYGLISSYDIFSGNPIASYNFGNETYSSGINSLAIVNNQYYLGGFTKETPNEYFSWFLKYNF
jgi:hypothetical protein